MRSALIEVHQSGALTLPSAAILIRDGQTFCYCVEHGKAVRTPLKVGVRQGEVFEVLKKQLASGQAG